MPDTRLPKRRGRQKRREETRFKGTKTSSETITSIKRDITRLITGAKLERKPFVLSPQSRDIQSLRRIRKEVAADVARGPQVKPRKKVTSADTTRDRRDQERRTVPEGGLIRRKKFPK